MVVDQPAVFSTVLFGYEIHLYSSLYSIYTILQQCHKCNTVHHKLYTLNQVTVQYQLCSTILTYCTVHSLHLYIHTPYLYLHLKYITVHRTFSDTTVQLYLRTVYILGEQYTVHTRLTVHIITCSLFTLTLLTAALLCSYSTMQQPEAVCLSICLSTLAGGCKGRKERERKRKGRGKYFSAEIGNLALPTLYCTHTV